MIDKLPECIITYYVNKYLNLEDKIILSYVNKYINKLQKNTICFHSGYIIGKYLGIDKKDHKDLFEIITYHELIQEVIEVIFYRGYQCKSKFTGQNKIILGTAINFSRANISDCKSFLINNNFKTKKRYSKEFSKSNYLKKFFYKAYALID